MRDYLIGKLRWCSLGLAGLDSGGAARLNEQTQTATHCTSTAATEYRQEFALRYLEDKMSENFLGDWRVP